MEEAMTPSNVIGHITVDPPDPRDMVTKRMAAVVFESTGSSNSSFPIQVDLTNGPGTFAAPIGEKYIITAVDTNSFGDSYPVSITGVVPSFTNTNTPKPGTTPRPVAGLAVTFSPAP